MSGFELILDKVKILVVNELHEPLRCCNSFFFFSCWRLIVSFMEKLFFNLSGFHSLNCF